MRGFGRGFSNYARGRGRMPNGDKPGSGPSGRCVCTQCDYSFRHITGKPCNQMKCPRCGASLTRE